VTKAYLLTKILLTLVLVAAIVIVMTTVVIPKVMDRYEEIRDALSSAETRIDSLEAAVFAASSAAVDRELDSLALVVGDMETGLRDCAVRSVLLLFDLQDLREEIDARRSSRASLRDETDEDS
jgi:hypothetical protein